MTPRTFAVPTPDLRKVGLLFAFVLGTIAVSLVLVLRNPEAARVWPVLLAVAIAVTALLALVVLRRRVQLHHDALRIVAGLNSTTVPVSMLDLDAARIVRLDEHPEFRPGIKTFGTDMPGYRAGHFRQGGGRKVFALLTSRDRVLVLPERAGRLLLLSVADPQALLDALRRAHPVTGRGG